MLYVFSNNKGVQIAWNSQAPHAHRDARSSDSEKRSIFGFIRTFNLG